MNEIKNIFRDLFPNDPKPTKGKLKELEDLFLTRNRKKHKLNSKKVVSLLDKMKRNGYNDRELVQLEQLIKIK